MMVRNKASQRHGVIPLTASRRMPIWAARPPATVFLQALTMMTSMLTFSDACRHHPTRTHLRKPLEQTRGALTLDWHKRRVCRAPPSVVSE